jgi:hypothetical protein
MEGMVLGKQGTATIKTAGPVDLQPCITGMHEEVRNTWKCFITLLHSFPQIKIHLLFMPGMFRLHKFDWLRDEKKQQQQVGNANLT